LPRTAPPSGLGGRFLAGFEHGFDRIRDGYSRALAAFIAHRRLSLTGVTVMILGFATPVLGRWPGFLPDRRYGTDAASYPRSDWETRIESTVWLVSKIDRDIRRVIPRRPASKYQRQHRGSAVLRSRVLPDRQCRRPGRGHHDRAQSDTSPNGFLCKGDSRQTRARLSWRLRAYFQPADIISQVLTFGLSAPIDAQVSGPNLSADYVLASRLLSAMQRIPGIVDLRIAEPLNYPSFKVDVDRAKALELGLTESDVASSLLTLDERQFPARA